MRLGFDPLDTAPLLHEISALIPAAREEPERQRPPRPKRPAPGLRDASIEIGAVRGHRRSSSSTFLGVVLLHGRRDEHAAARARSSSRRAQDFATLDPALAQTPDAWELEYATCAKLLNYPPRSGYRGTRLVPEVAAALPTVSPDRLTTRSTLRPGWRFSDGSRVTAASFARALERARSPELRLAGRHVPARGALVAGVRADADDPACSASAPDFAAAARAAVLLRRPDAGAERAARQPSVGRPVRDRRATPAAVRCCCSGTRTTTARARRTSSDRLPLRRVPVADQTAARATERPTTASSRRRRSRSSRDEVQGRPARTCSSCSSRSSRTWR